MPAVHVAIVNAHVAAGLLDGRKRVESRFARQRRLPYGRIRPGDQIYFKVSGGDIIGRALAARVQQFHSLTPAAVASLQRRYSHAVLAPPAYWRARRHCRYAVLIWLGPFTRRRPRVVVPRQHGNAWVLLSGRTRQCPASCRSEPSQRDA